MDGRYRKARPAREGGLPASDRSPVVGDSRQIRLRPEHGNISQRPEIRKVSNSSTQDTRQVSPNASFEAFRAQLRGS